MPSEQSDGMFSLIIYKQPAPNAIQIFYHSQPLMLSKLQGLNLLKLLHITLI